MSLNGRIDRLSRSLRGKSPPMLVVVERVDLDGTSEPGLAVIFPGSRRVPIRLDRAPGEQPDAFLARVRQVGRSA